jgi:predicted amidohydrolase
VRTIETAIENSHFDDCFVTVFPELVIDPVSLLEIERQLVEKPFLKGRNPVPPTLIVAGSWHEKHSDGFRNAAHVFDGSGDRVASYSKRLSYGGGRVARERIEPGSDFPILVTRDGLVAFAICLDFCDRQFDGVYGTLDVDFLLVPSCGDEKTMESHLQNASRSDTRYSTATFVVQQAYPKKPRSNGYVLLAADGASPTSKSTKVNATWVRKFT